MTDSERIAARVYAMATIITLAMKTLEEIEAGEGDARGKAKITLDAMGTVARHLEIEMTAPPAGRA